VAGAPGPELVVVVVVMVARLEAFLADLDHRVFPLGVLEHCETIMGVIKCVCMVTVLLSIVSCLRRVSPTTNVLPSAQPVWLNLALQPHSSPTTHCVAEASDARHATAATTARSSTCLEDAIGRCRFAVVPGEQLTN
jgi:hypothetical protein